MATPPFLPTDSSVPLPGMPPTNPAATPTTLPSPDAKFKQILGALIANAQRKQAGGTPVPGQVDPQQSMDSARSIGMNTKNPRAWGSVRFMAGIQTQIQNAVAKKKQNDILKAEGDWTYMQSALNELYAAQQSGDQQALQSAQNKLDVVLGDPKKLKNMAKALNQDWLNPEKTTVYGDALKKVNADTQAKDAKQMQAAQGIKGLFQRLIQRQQQPQLSPDQQRSMASEITAKAPTTSPGAMDPKTFLEIARGEADLAKAEKDLRATPEKYETKVVKDADGTEKIVAVDKTNPTKPYIEIKSASGEKAKPGEKRYANDGKLELQNGIPTGRVMHQGKYVAPGREGYTKDDAEAVVKAMEAHGLSRKEAERLAAVHGQAYASTAANFRFTNVTDKLTGEVTEVSAREMAANPGRYSGAAEQEKISARDAVHESLDTNFKALGDSLDKLPNGLDLETQATLKAALRSDNPGMIETLMVNKVKAGASDETLQYLTNIKAMQEDIMTLRTVGGMGQGSDMMRNAMVSLIPGPGTGSVREAKMQIAAAKRTSDALFSRRPQSKLPVGPGTDAGKGGATTGGFKKNADGSYTEQ